MAKTKSRRERKAKASLRATFVALALLTVLPFLALVAVLAWSQVTREQGRVRTDALAQAGLLAAQVDKHVGARVEAVGGAAALVGGGPGVADVQARRLKQAFPDFERVVIVNELGVALAAAPPVAEGRSLAVGDQDWFKRAATATDTFVGPPRPSGPDVVVGIYAPARTAEGQLRGVVAADLVLRRVQDIFLQARLAPGAAAELVSERGVVLARVPSLFLMRDVRREPGYGDALSRPGGTGDFTFADGERRLAGTAPVRPTGWVLSVGFASAGVVAEIRRELLLVGGASLFLTILALVSAVVVSRRQTLGMARLRSAMSRVQGGDLPASLPVTVGGEVGALTESFNRMLGWLRAKLREYEVLSQVEEAAGQAITGDRSANGMLQGLLRRVVSGVGADVGVLLLEEDAWLVTRAAVGFPGMATDGVRLRRSQGLAGAAVSDRAATVVSDVETDYRIEEPYVKEGGVRSIVAVPMLAGDDAVVGVVEVGYRSPHAFADGEVQRLEAIVKRTAQAIERARAQDAVQRSTHGLETQLAEKLEALQKATTQQAEAQRQAQEARKKTQELERRIQQQERQPAPPPQVKEVIVEREVVRADPAAEQVTRLRAEMQKTVSEELRAPLTALLDLPRFLVEGLQKPLAEAERSQLEILHERGQEILELIQGLTVLTGLEAGQTKVARSPFDLAALVHRAVRSLQSRAAAKGNRIEADIKLGTTVQVVSDARRVEQVLTNLLLSAIKYTEVGEIRVTCLLRDGEVVMTVADDGAGFSPGEQARIFEPFLQVGPREGRSLPGTGLLLTVVERLTTALGGKVRVESEVDRGTWVTVTLPGTP